MEQNEPRCRFPRGMVPISRESLTSSGREGKKLEISTCWSSRYWIDRTEKIGCEDWSGRLREGAKVNQERFIRSWLAKGAQASGMADSIEL